MKTSILVAAVCAAMHGLFAADSLPLVNSAFEDSKTGVPPGWTLGGKGFRLVGGHGYYGTRGLAWDSATPCPDGSSVACQSLKGWRKGVRYRYSVYVRTVNLECPEGFPYIGLSFGKGETAKVCDVRTDIPVSGVREYARFEGFVESLPEDAENVTIVLGVSKGVKGRVIFDNVDVVEMGEPSLSFLCSDAYRAMAAEGEVEFHAAVYPPCDPAKSRASFRFVDASGKQVVRSAQRLEPDVFSLKIDVSEMAFGTNQVTGELFCGSHVSTASLGFAHVRELPARRVCIDRHGRCMVDGRPFYPLGMFVNRVDADMIAAFSNTPFNCVAPFCPVDRSGLNVCRKAGLMAFGGRGSVILGSYWGKQLKLDTQEKVEAFHRKEVMSLKDHPALLGWFVFDEPPAAEIPARRRLCELYREWDPDHPMWGVHCRTDELRGFMQTADVLGIDSYPIGYHGDKAEQVIATPTRLTREGLKTTFGAMPFWNTPQSYSWSWLKVNWNPGARFPTMAEMRSMNWQHIAAGANGVISFSFGSMQKQPDFPRLWKQTVSAHEEIAKVVPILLSVEPRPSVVPSDPDRLSCRTWVKDGKLYLLACNLTTNPLAASADLEYGDWNLEDRYLPDGDVTVAGRKVRYTLPPMGVSFIRLAPAKPTVAEVREYGGMPALWINGKPSNGLMHWNRHMKPQDVAVFRKAGVHLYSFMGTPEMPNPHGGDVDYGEGALAAVPILTPDMIDRTMEMIVANDPEAQVLVRVRMVTPDWFRKAHADEMIKVYDVALGDYAVTSCAGPSGKAWRALMDSSLRKVIRHCETKWGNHIIGYHPGLGSCAENSYSWGCCVADYSKSHIAKFGGEAPKPTVFVSKGCRDRRRLLDPAKESEAVRFRRFLSDEMADCVLFLARSTKDELARLGRTKICGVFYGYFFFWPNGGEVLGCGHYSLQRVLSSPDVDMVSGPFDYSVRGPGGAGMPQTVPGSIALHGKLYYGEEDTRTHLAVKDAFCVSDNVATSYDLLWRNFINVFAEGGTTWWMDLFGQGWFRDPWYASEIEKCRVFMDAHLANRASQAQVAVFVSERSTDVERLAPLMLSNEACSPTMAEVAAIGAPSDIYLLEDLPLLAEKGRLLQYRLVILPTAHAVDETTREAVKNLLCRDGRTVVFSGYPGYIRGREKGAACVKDMTGITVTEVTGNGSARGAYTVEAFPDGRRIMWGSERDSLPWLVVNDSSAEEMGWFVHGAMLCNPKVGRGAALATRKFPTWRSVLCTVPGIPSELLRKFAEEAGVHVYSKHGDQVFAGDGWFAVAAKMPGKRVLYPRGPGAKPIEVDLPRGGFKFFNDR